MGHRPTHHPFVTILSYITIFTVFFFVRKWRRQRKAKRDAAAIKNKGVVLDVTNTWVRINNQRQYDVKIELQQENGTFKTAILTENFDRYSLPNVGDEVVVCINPEDKYDRWILR